MIENITINSTIEMVGVIKPYLSTGAGLLWLLPGTQVFNEARANGFISDDYWLKSDDVPYNLQEHSYKELCKLRQLLMWGIAKKKVGSFQLSAFILSVYFIAFPSYLFFDHLYPIG